jgi:hypothetical protein
MGSRTPERLKRTWIYVHRPVIYDIACDYCGGHNLEWSEWAEMVWCVDCQIDTRGNGGIFDGPVAAGALEVLGISLDRIDLETGQYLRHTIKDNHVVWEPIEGEELEAHLERRQQAISKAKELFY